MASSHAYRVTGLSSLPSRMLNGTPTLTCPPTRSRPLFQDTVLALAEEAGPCLVVPGRDEDAAALCELYERLTLLGCSLASGPAPAVLQAYDKASTPLLLAGSALSMARTAATAQDALELAGQVGYPLLIKPRHGNASHGVRFAHTEDELRAHFTSGQDIAQEFVPLEPEDRRSWDRAKDRHAQDGEYSVQLLIGPLGHYLGCFTTRNNLQQGVPRLVEVVDAGALGVADQAYKALTRHGAWGAWNLQGRRTPNGGVRFFEVNARPTGLTGLRARLGFNELDQLYEACVLRRPPQPAQPPEPGLVIDMHVPEYRTRAVPLEDEQATS
ncbi:ATP-binding protein [Streptomyces sp. NPDC055013]